MKYELRVMHEKVVMPKHHGLMCIYKSTGYKLYIYICRHIFHS